RVRTIAATWASPGDAVLCLDIITGLANSCRHRKGVVVRCDRIWRNARLATMAGAGLVEDGVIAAQGDRIVYAGSAGEAPAFEAKETVDCEGRWITPGLIDPHTHLIH